MTDRRHLLPLVTKARADLQEIKDNAAVRIRRGLSETFRVKKDHGRLNARLRRLVMQLGISDLRVEFDGSPARATKFVITLSHWDRHKKAVVAYRTMTVTRENEVLFLSIQHHFNDLEKVLAFVTKGYNLSDRFILVNEDIYERYEGGEWPRYRKLEDWTHGLADFVRGGHEKVSKR